MRKTKISRFLFCMIVVLSFFLVSCTNLNAPKKHYNTVNPITGEGILGGDENIGFVQMHNSVIDGLKSEMTPFFFIKENMFDISGDNEKKEIYLTFDCLEGTTEADASLVVVWVSKLMANEASIQQSRFKPSTKDSYGTLFDEYALIINCTEEGKDLIVKTIRPGEEMPYDARIVRDLNDDEDTE
ncbi:MAG: hypothetical protein Q4F88_03725 [Eubacteriales bacterium]|nr:hypothetical protein [Eubacteriales bacterium]